MLPHIHQLRGRRLFLLVSLLVYLPHHQESRPGSQLISPLVSPHRRRVSLLHSLLMYHLESPLVVLAAILQRNLVEFPAVNRHQFLVDNQQRSRHNQLVSRVDNPLPSHLANPVGTLLENRLASHLQNHLHNPLGNLPGSLLVSQLQSLPANHLVSLLGSLLVSLLENLQLSRRISHLHSHLHNHLGNLPGSLLVNQRQSLQANHLINLPHNQVENQHISHQVNLLVNRAQFHPRPPL